MKKEAPLKKRVPGPAYKDNDTSILKGNELLVREVGARSHG